jgi:hypothetical protein
MLGILTALISPVANIITGHQKAKAEKVKGKQAIEAALVKSQVDKIERGDLSDIKLDQDARNHAGLMDDISFYVFLAPALLSFYPPALPHILAGFQALEKMPQWWQYGLGMMLVSVWGYRKLVSPIIMSIAKAWMKK